MTNVVILDTGCANLSSVKFAIERLGYAVQVSLDPAVVRQADKVFLPGVGTAKEAMRNLEDRQLPKLIKSLTQPVLGICLGMQLLTKISQEIGATQGQQPCLGLVDGEVKLMDAGDLPLPHMGWNQISPQENHPLFKDIPDGEHFYFVHSYAVPAGAYTIASCQYGEDFSAAIQQDNFYGVQFHPERSGKAGAQLIKNFLEM